MSRQQRRRIAEETIQITHRGWYYRNGKRIDLPHADFSAAILIDAEEAERAET